MGGRAQRGQTKKARKPLTDSARQFAADTMMDLVTKWVARQLSEARPRLGDFEEGEIPSLPEWAEYKRLQKQLERLLEQTRFIAEIMTGER